MNTRFSLSVIIPVHNEIDVLPTFYERLLPVLDKSPLLDRYEAIFVDDGSFDDSGSCLHNLARQNPAVHIITHTEKRGQCAALKSGFDVAQFDRCLTIDADLQIPPEEIPKLLEHAITNDVVNGWRQTRHDHMIIKWSSAVFNWLCRVFLASEFRDASSNFTLFRLDLVRELPLIRNDHRYLLFIARLRKARSIVEVPVAHQTREFGVSKYSQLKALGGSLEFIIFLVRKRRFAMGNFA
ncbi:MAG: glycosyltransferase family 2 protein [Proteobacteria bacterium]|nr:glycosyltransferase family 2 protein [Pseudomonadota bacterium]